MSHDPLCTTALNTEMSEAFCNCDLIARVREDERSGLPVVMFGNGDEKAVAQTWDAGYAAALRDAVEAVKALGQLSEYGIWHKDGGYCDGEEIVAAIEALGGER